MAMRLVLGRAGSGKTEHCLRAILGELRAGLVEGPRLIFLVPEQATLQMERSLLVQGPHRALGRCEVISFKRLAHRILNEAVGHLPVPMTAVGRTMLLRSVLARRQRDLREFHGVALRPGFAAALSKNVVELIRQAVSPERLEEAVAASREGGEPEYDRLYDLALIYREYLAALGDRRVDPEGVLDLARGRLDGSAWLRGSRIWVDGFAGFTAQQLRLLVELARRAERMEVTLLVDPARTGLAEADAPPDRLSLFARTERTGYELLRALRAGGVAVEGPLMLAPAALPRFRAEAIGRIERHLFGSGERSTLPRGETENVVRIVEHADRRGEVAAAVREVRRLVQVEGSQLRYRDIAIVVRDLSAYHDLLSAALHEHGVPFFIDRRRPTSHHPLVELVRAALRLRGDREAGGAAIPAMLKTGLTPLTREQSDALENYQRKHGLYSPAAWSGEPWRYPPFDEAGGEGASLEERGPAGLRLNGPGALRARIRRHAGVLRAVNQARDRLLSALGAWWPAEEPEKRPRACRGHVGAMRALLERLKVEQRLTAWVREAERSGDLDEAQEHAQVWADFTSLLDEMEHVLGDEPMTHAEFTQVLEAALAEFQLGLVPPTLDQVLVGSIERSRHPPIRAMFVLGFADGLFPLPHGEDAVLGDAEREALERRGVLLEPGRRTRLLDERLLAYIALTRPSERLWISYPAADEQGREVCASPYLPAVLAALGRPAEAIERLPAEGGASLESIWTVEQLAAGLGGALRRVASGRSSEEEARWLAGYERARSDAAMAPRLARALAGLRPYRQPALDGPEARATREALWPEPAVLGVTQVESFARCPFQHFAQYGLRLQPRAEHELSALQLGRLYHAMLDEFVNRLIETGKTLADLSPRQIGEELEAMAESVVPRLAEQTLMEPPAQAVIRRRARRELDPAVQSQQRTAEPGLSPAATERGFGTSAEDALPALEVTTASGRQVLIRGRVDRIDLLRTADETRAVGFAY
jgi:ATP-dependent helicase/nuclease subunit B